MIGLSGLVVTRTGYVVISDSNTDKRAIRVWLLDRQCHLVRSISYPTSAYDPEDAAVGRDGAIYVADIGDNGSRRSSIGTLADRAREHAAASLPVPLPGSRP